MYEQELGVIPDVLEDFVWILHQLLARVGCLADFSINACGMCVSHTRVCVWFPLDI